jgi:hypothetical protein
MGRLMIKSKILLKILRRFEKCFTKNELPKVRKNDS